MIKKWGEKIFFLAVFCICFAGAFFFKSPMVSVIMPTYNRETFLPRAIESILNQTYTDFEFIIVDDGSTDNSIQIIKEYAQKDKRIRLIRNEENKGIAYSRERGKNAARGTYIAIMDSDDISFPTRLEKQVEYLQTHKDIAVVIGLTKNQANGNIWWRPTDPQEIIFDMHFDNAIGNPQTMIRRSFLIKHNIEYKDYRAAEDYDFFKQIIFAGGKISRTEDVVLAVRYHGENPDDYYVLQSANRVRVSKEFLKKYDIDWFGRSTPTCDVVTHMLNNNKANLLSTEYLKKKQAQLCQDNK